VVTAHVCLLIEGNTFTISLADYGLPGAIHVVDTVKAEFLAKF
jgi:hypothetical protein